jgi:hypothetical protein
MVGNITRAEALAKDAGNRRPQDTQIQSLWLPAIHAQLALYRHQPKEALNKIGAALPLELGQIPFASNLSCLYPTYIRGMAYLAANSGTAAASEFQKILDHNGIVWNCWTGVLAHVGLARANALQSQELYGEDADNARLRALMAYRAFLKQWKGADPDIPVLRQVREELAKPQQ